tara:strand:+ start:486 stop:1856 length:1371 start_codon:yes stop_codon:yes gene_type:complete
MKGYVRKLLREGLLSEGATPIIYHFTYESRLENILSGNKFNLTSNLASKADQMGDKVYYMSFSRTKSIKHGYGTKSTNPSSVRIKIDGTKLNQRYKVISVDYWQYPRTIEFMGGIGDEMEERVVSNGDEIKDASEYIISIDIFLPKDGVTQSIIDNAKVLGIKLYFFDNVKDFASGISERSVKPIINTKEKENRGSSFFRYSNETMGALTYKEPEIKEKLYNYLIKLGHNEENLDAIIDPIHKKYKYYLRPNDDYSLTDLANSLNANLSNNKTEADPMVRYILKEFIKNYRKVGAESIKDYLNIKLYKGKKTQRDYNKELSIEFDKLIISSYKKHKEYLDFSVYDKNDNSIDSFIKLPEVNKFLNDKVNKIRKYVLDYIKNNDNLFKDWYRISRDDIKNNIDLYDGLDAILKNFGDDQVSKHEFEYVMSHILWSIDDFGYKLRQLKDEYHKQFYGN